MCKQIVGVQAPIIILKIHVEITQTDKKKGSSYESAILSSDIYPKDFISYYRDIYSFIFTTVLFTIARSHK